MSEIATIIVAMLAVLVATRSASRLERIAVSACLLFHVALAWFHVWLAESYYGGVSDMLGYLDEGRVIARLLDFDFGRFAPEVAKLAMHQENSLPAYIAGEGMGTGTMAAFSGTIAYVCGESHVAACLVTGGFATIGQYLMYCAARPMLPSGTSRLALVGFLFVPSVIFWSSAFSKEGFVVGFLGILCYSAQRFSSGKKLALLPAAIGGVGIGILKPYVLFPFVLAVGSWYYASRTQGRHSRLPIFQLVVAIIVAVMGILIMGALFPEFSLEHLGEQTALLQGLGAEAGGGSFTQIGDSSARSLAQQLPFVPLALITVLFRPLLFEARNGPMAGAALETTVLIIATGSLLLRLRPRVIFDVIRRSPLLSFSLVFVATFSVAVGLATTNLGTLSRYRIPMMPFYVILILLLRHELTSSARATGSLRLGSSS